MKTLIIHLQYWKTQKKKKKRKTVKKDLTVRPPVSINVKNNVGKTKDNKFYKIFNKNTVKTHVGKM